MYIEVSNAHILTGKQASINSCPLALALNEQLNCISEVCKIKGHGDSIRLHLSNDEIHTFYPDKPLINWINRFDIKLPVQPIRVVLNTTNAIATLIA